VADKVKKVKEEPADEEEKLKEAKELEEDKFAIFFYTFSHFTSLRNAHYL
jgi:hypothetical protein